jgi:hypothetical protein
VLSLSVGGVAFDFPETGESNWGDDVSAWATAISAQSLYKSGGSFVLTAETDFGSFFGLKSLYYKSRTANPATAGQVRLARADVISWRNQLNSANVDLAVNASNQLTFGGVVLGLSSQPTFSDTATVDLTMNVNDVTADVIAGSLTNTHINAAAAIAYSKLNLGTSIVNADVSASAAIAYSKLNLGTSIVNADINASAAIAYSKLNLGTSIVNADINASAAIAYSKLNLATSIVNADVSATAAIAYSKLNLTGTLLNADINASAAIARSKIATGTANRLVYNLTGTGAMTDLAAITASRILQSDSSGLPVAGNAVTASRMVQSDSNGFLTANAAITASRAVASDSNGFLVAAATTATELGYVNGVTSAIQTQLNALAPGLTLLQVYSPSTAASVDITSIISGTYSKYMITFDLRPATDSVALRLRTDSNNGASFDAGASDYQYAVTTVNSAGTVSGSASTGATQIQLGSGVIGNATNEGTSGVIWLTFVGSAAMYAHFNFIVADIDTSTLPRSATGSGFRANAAAIDAVQLLFSSGNIASGTVRIYGLKNS